MPDRRQHRSHAQADVADFATSAVPALRRATVHLSWLLTRGYADRSALELMGNRFALTARQRVAVSRCACPEAARRARAERETGQDGLRGEPILVDGFNLLVTLEAALAGGVLLIGRDGCMRDMASVHGTYRRVQETLPALGLAGAWLGAAGCGAVTWLLDRPVSNSGRLADVIRDLAASEGWPWRVELVDDPDRALISRPEAPVVTADRGVLDRCGPWVCAARSIVEEQIRDAWVVDLRARRG